MKTLSFLFFLFIGLVSCQKNTNSSLSQNETQKSLLWQITGRGIKTSYLYGTMHTNNEKVIRLSDRAIDELEACQVMAGELVLNEKDMMSMMMTLFMQDTTLEMLLSKDEYEVVHKKMTQKMGIMAEALERIKPIFVTIMIGENGNDEEKTDAKSTEKDNSNTKKNPFSMFEGANKKPPLDLYLQEKAKNKGKEVVGLETVEEQMAAFNTITLKEQAKMLYETVVNEDKDGGKESKKTMEAMLNLYYRQEIDSLYLMTTQSLTNVTNDKLLTDRNLTMLNRMEKIMKEKSVFTAVGAAHLGGNMGLINLLRKKGYKVVAKI